MDIKEIPDDKLHVIVKAAVEATLSEGGYICIRVVGSLAEIDISKVPHEVSMESTD